MRKFYTSRLLNYVEPAIIGSQYKTAFYSQINTNFEIGDKVFISNGTYDSDAFNISIDYTRGFNGYEILDIDRCRIVLDIDWTGELPYTTYEPYQYINIHNINSQKEFDYINTIEFNTNNGRYNKFSFYYNSNRLGNNIIYTDQVYVPSLIHDDDFKNHNGLSTIGFNYRNDVILNNEIVSSTWTNINNIINDGLLPDDTRLKIIGEDIVLPSGQILKENHVYKYDYDNNIWIEDISHYPAIISKLIFRNGSFKGTWNDGLYGSYEERSNWIYPDATWNSGMMVNVDWDNGIIGSKSVPSEQSFYAKLENGKVIQLTDYSNNSGYGYNHFIDCKISNSTIINGTFEECKLIGDNTNKVLEEYFEGDINNFNNSIKIKGGLYYNSILKNVNLENSITKFSIIDNIQSINSKITSSQTNNSLINKNSLIGDTETTINVIGGTIWNYTFNNINPSLVPNVSGVIKLWISENDYAKFRNLDGLYLNNINKKWINNLSDDDKIFSLLEGKYILDSYYKFGSDITVSVKNKKENEYSTRVIFDGINYITEYDLNTNPMCSIDIDLGSYFYAYYNIIDNNFVFSSNIPPYLRKVKREQIGPNSIRIFDLNNIFTNSTLDVLNIEKSYIINSTWNGASYENTTSNTIQLTSEIVNGFIINNLLYLDINLSQDDDSLVINDYVYVEHIEYIEDITNNRTLISDVFKVKNIQTFSTYRTVELEPLNMDFSNFNLNGVLTILPEDIEYNGDIATKISPTYISLYTTKINNSIIKSGLLKNILFTNSVVKNTKFNNNDVSFALDNINRLRLINIYFKDTNNTIESGIIYNSHIIKSDLGNNTNWIGGLLFKSIWYNEVFKNGVGKNVYWVTGILDGATLYDMNNLNLTNLNFDSKNHLSVFNNGYINNGELNNIIIRNVEFNNGRFISGELWNGVINGGVFGTKNNRTNAMLIANIDIDPINNILTHVIINNATIDNALVGGNGKVDWYNGLFNGGEFTSYKNIATAYSTWHNGVFSGSMFSRNGKWKNGIFKKGKFISIYGAENVFIPTTGGYMFSTNINDYAWENGEFYGETFGTKDVNVYNNSTWYNGKMYGGVFEGSIWKYGIKYGGTFNGSGLRKPILGEEWEWWCNRTPDILPDVNNSPEYFNVFEGTPQEKLDKITLLYNNTLDVINNISLFKPISHTEIVNNKTIHPSSISCKETLDYQQLFKSSYSKEFYGLWIDGIVSDTEYKSDPDINISDTNLTVNEDAKLLVSNINNALILNIEQDHKESHINNSLILSANVKNGEQNDSILSPYVYHYNSTEDLFELKFSDIESVWENGTLNGGIIYKSFWKNGKVLDGILNGVVWENGIVEYGWANNVVWINGKWKNGNVDASPFDYTTINIYESLIDPPFGYANVFASEILSYCKDYSFNNDIHINNVISADYMNGGNNMVSLQKGVNPNWAFFYRQKPLFSTEIEKEYPWTYRIVSDTTRLITKIEPYNLSYSFPFGWRETDTINGLFRRVTIDQYSTIYNPVLGGSTSSTFSHSSMSAPLNIITKRVENLNNGTYKYYYPYTNASYNTLNINNPTLVLCTIESPTATMSDMMIFREKYESNTNSIILYDIEVGIHLAVSYARPIDVNSPKQPIYLRLVAGRKLDSGQVVANDKIDVIEPNSFDWVGQHTMKMSYSPLYDDIDNGSSAVSYTDARNIMLNGTRPYFNGRVIKNDEFYIYGGNQLTMNPKYSIDTSILLEVSTNSIGNQPVFIQPGGPPIDIPTAQREQYKNQLFDIFVATVLYVNVFGIVNKYVPLNNTLYNSYDNLWLIPIEYDNNPIVFNTTVITPKLMKGQLKLESESTSFCYGNGTFKSGIWENGVWNQGWRDSEIIRFNSLVFSAIKIDTYSWDIEIECTNTDIDLLVNINIYDRVSISNIIGMSVNDDRVLLTNYGVVTQKDGNILTIRINTTNDLRAIVVDSKKHYISISKSIWLNGVFFNGMFRGIWNYGMFKGFPEVSIFQNSHWIDGIFDGGKILSKPYDNSTIKKTSLQLYNGTEVNFNTTLVQNFVFYDNNTQNEILHDYYTWLDIDYDNDDESRVTILSDKYFDNYDYLTQIGNLGGPITYDIMSSKSYLRDSESYDIKEYNLGIKYKKDKDYLPDYISNFANKYSVYVQGVVNDILQLNIDELENDNWTINVSRSEDPNATINTRPVYTNKVSNYKCYITNIPLQYGYGLYKGTFDKLPVPSSAWATNTYIRYNGEYYRLEISGSIYQWTKVALVFTNRFLHFGNSIIFTHNLSSTAEISNNILSSGIRLATLSNTLVGGNSTEQMRINNKYITIDNNRYSKISYKISKAPIIEYRKIDPNTTHIFPTGVDVQDPKISSKPLIFPYRYTYFGNQQILNFGYVQSYKELHQALVPKYSEVGEHEQYFYNKNGLNMTFGNDSWTSLLSNNGQKFEIEMDYIQFSEVNMIPFFKLTYGIEAEDGVNRSVVSPWVGIANKNLSDYVGGIVGSVNIGRDYFIS